MATPPPPAPPVPTSNTIPASSFYQIKPLGQDNWLAWKRRIQAVLRGRKLIGHIDGTISEPPWTDARYRVWKEDNEKRVFSGTAGLFPTKLHLTLDLYCVQLSSKYHVVLVTQSFTIHILLLACHFGHSSCSASLRVWEFRTQPLVASPYKPTKRRPILTSQSGALRPSL